MTPLLTLELREERDVVLARQRARQLAALLGFDAQEQTRLATAVSEVARNAYRYAGGGRVTLDVAAGPPAELVVRVADTGPGIRDLDAVLDGRYVSSTGMGLGLVGARRLTDRLTIDTARGRGTTVELARALPRRAAPPDRDAVARALARHTPASLADELTTQNGELLRTIEELRARQAEVARLNEELEETNRGVLALYAELDERALALKRASEQKSSFLSNVSHELRTPLTSILNIARLMLDHGMDPLTEEQRRQLGFVRSSAQSLSEIVNDLLDLAKIEAGRVDVRPSRVSLAELFGTLRGMFRPLVTSDAVTLTFEEPPDVPVVTDEQRLSQILRNLISNAIKYTPRGEVRVAVAAAEGDALAFTVRDTGIGIPEEYLERIFEEFVQVEGAHQRHVKGTGLGLPLSRQLARLLGGTIAVRSAPGVGSTFVLTIPREDARAAPPLLVARGALGGDA